MNDHKHCGYIDIYSEDTTNRFIFPFRDPSRERERKRERKREIEKNELLWEQMIIIILLHIDAFFLQSFVNNSNHKDIFIGNKRKSPPST